MSQVVQRRKKGRPSKADLARRMSSSPADQGYEPRRSLRPRNVRYNFDIDDYLDGEEDEDEAEERRREKKLNLLLKMNQSRASADPPSRGRGRPPAARRLEASDEEEEVGEEGGGGEEEEEDVEEEDDESEKKPVKKRKINGEEDKDYGEEEEHVDDDEDDEEERRRKVADKKSDSGPGTPCELPSMTPMPDKKSLELILDKLQKKDIYGVYAEPVDPEELPDYHDIVEHPMDFATVRKKLVNGSYSMLEEFESDVFLICSNAMLYNSPDTVYHKQARTIQEMAKKKFKKIRIKIERAEKDPKSEQKTKHNFSAKKQMKQPSSRTSLEPVDFDFSSGANIMANGEAIQNGSVTTQAGGCEKHNYTDGVVDGNTSLVDNLDKAEDCSSGKSLLGKFGRKQSAVDENRRATYNTSNQPPDKSKTIFTTFEGEIKQLVTVGLHAEHAYARSLACFAATLGPIAWKVASERIEQALPAGFKFGRGWVGEYEPLPTPVLLLETLKSKESSLFSKSQSSTDTRKDEMPCKIPVPVKEQIVSEHISEGKSSLFRTSGSAVSEGNSSFVPSPRAKPNTMSQQQNPLAQTFVDPRNKIPRQVELNLPPTDQSNSVPAAEQQGSDKSETKASRSSDKAMRNVNLVQSAHLKSVVGNGVFPGTLPSGKLTSRMIGMSSDTAPNHPARATTHLPHGQDQGLTDPVRLMRSLTEKAQMQQQQSPSNQPQVNPPSGVSSVPSIRTDDSSNATVSAARAWMSIGSGGFKKTAENCNSPKSQMATESLYNPARELHSTQLMRPRGGEFPISAGMEYQPERNHFPFQVLVPQPVINGIHLQNRPMAFPQSISSEFPRFQVQSPWRGITPHVQLKQKQENLPPDLNIGVQSPDSPAKQPDLALQL